MLNVKEIFFEIQGENTFVGFPSIFICLNNSNPENYYSTKKTGALPGERLMTVEEIVDEIKKFNCYMIYLTGADFSSQNKSFLLVSELISKNYLVLLEASIGDDIKNVNSKAIILQKINCKNDDNKGNKIIENLKYLRPKDQLLFVISSSKNYHWAKDLIFKEMIFEKCNIIFFADSSSLSTATLAEWILTDQLPVRLGFKLKNIII